MTIEEQLRDLIIKHSGSVNRFANECGLSQSTIFTIFNRGIGKANIQSIITICRELNISTDELVQGRITPLQYLDANLEYINISELTEENQTRIKDYYNMLIRLQKGEK